MEVPETAFKFNLWHDLYTPIWGKNLRYSYYSSHFTCLTWISVLFICQQCNVHFTKQTEYCVYVSVCVTVYTRRRLWAIETAHMHSSIENIKFGKHLDRWLSNCIVIFRFNIISCFMERIRHFQIGLHYMMKLTISVV